jgi:hypothetical protein
MSANIEFIITEIFPIYIFIYIFLYLNTVDASVSNRWNILNEGMVLNNNEALFKYFFKKKYNLQFNFKIIIAILLKIFKMFIVYIQS